VSDTNAHRPPESPRARRTLAATCWCCVTLQLNIFQRQCEVLLAGGLITWMRNKLQSI
jgi:hypothetical protein